MKYKHVMIYGCLYTYLKFKNKLGGKKNGERV